MDTCRLFLQKVLLSISLLAAGMPAALAQLTEEPISTQKWKNWGQVKTIGVAKASLDYKTNAADTSFLLVLEDERKELHNFFTIRFSSQGNTLDHLYNILQSFFEKENWNNKAYIRIFTLGDTKITVYKAAGLVQLKTLQLSCDKGRIRLTKNEINQLFNK
ncbi:hypothetical protein [Flavihumibacter sp. CACIAM 22H1]|uniref:hypothetical protein n=1 Tax=Flavihumibacter sp. CACIAM 22H1 TaxID=1812911 RepID=UPI0007A90C61|nr:hypothetical protein [Flavihumibacter sp. CACIAM 22H1]KYP13478.1 MAG: hypothetical protein A1D16_12330 [Flavihumibacter sp. CACIAM 22H1]